MPNIGRVKKAKWPTWAEKRGAVGLTRDAVPPSMAMVSVSNTGVVPLKVAWAGVTTQLALVGRPVQVVATLPVRPLRGVSVI